MIFGSSLFTGAFFAILAALFFHLNQRQGQRFLLLWSLAWLILFLQRLAIPVLQRADLPWLWSDVAAFSLAGALLLAGACLYVGPLRLGPFHGAVLGVAIGMGAVLIFTAFASVAPQLPRPWTAALALLGISSIGSGWLIERHRGDAEPGIARLAAVSLVVWGILQPVSWLFAARSGAGLEALVFVDLTIGTLLAIGLVLFGLEVARTHLSAYRIDPRDVFDEDPNMILVVQEGRYVFVNRSFRERSGWILEELEKESLLAYVAPEYREIADERLAARLRDEPVAEYELEFLDSRGARIPVIVHADPVLWKGRRALRYELTDITTRRRAEAKIHAINDQLQRINTELEQSNQLKTDFLSNTSHELRTPLTSIIANTEILEYEMCGPMNHEQRRVLANISRNSQHLLDMISRLLDFARHEEGHSTVRYERVDLRTLLSGVVETVRPLLEDGSRKITTEIDERIERCYLDGEKIYRVYLNLVENAIKFSASGEIHLGARQVDQELEGCVVDHGIGIPPEKLGEIFDAFRQVDASSTRPYQGVGLGLAICKQLIELHGGRIWAESTPGQGSAFRFRVPYRLHPPEPPAPGIGDGEGSAADGRPAERSAMEQRGAPPRSAS